MKDVTWKETRPGRWERPQSYLEKINTITRNVPKAFGRDNWAKNAVAKLEFSSTIEDPAEYLRTAWKQVRYNHPEIAAFPYNGNYVYRVGDSQSIALWVSATFSVVEDKSVDELLGRIPRNEQMMAYFLPHTSEIMIWSPHYRVDARGAIYCLNHLIESLENMDPDLTFGGCAKNLTPSLEATLRIDSSKTENAEKAVKKRMSAMEAHNPLIELKPTVTSTAPKYTQRHFIKLSMGDTSLVMASCKYSNRQLDVSLHAALINAVTKIAPPEDARSFMASFHFNLRTLIPDDGIVPKNSPTTYTSVITTEVDVSQKTTFNSYYSQLAPVYKTGYAPYLASSGLFHERLIEGKDGIRGEVDGQLQPRFAFLGTVDEHVKKSVCDGNIKVKDFWLGAETLTMRLMVHTWLWEDQLTLSVCYNESYWTKESVAELLEGMKETLMDVASGKIPAPAASALLVKDVTSSLKELNVYQKVFSSKSKIPTKLQQAKA